MLTKDNIIKIREALKTGQYLLLNPSIRNSSLKKGQAPQGFSDDEIKQGIVVREEDVKHTLC